MRAICALVDRSGAPLDAGTVAQLTAAAELIGPSVGATSSQGAVGFGVSRRKKPGAGGGEPPPGVVVQGDLRIVFDGEIDNRLELALALGGAGTPSPPSDADLVLAAYDRWGVELIQELIGDFAFALWDGKRRRLLCARDPVGVRPLFYAQRGDRLAATTQVRQLLTFLGGCPDPNEEFVAEFLLTGLPHPALGPFVGVHKLPPGHRLTADDQGVRVDRYWRPEELPKLRYSDSRDYAEHFRTVFSEVVGWTLRGSAPVWAELSGGLDSSSIVATAGELFRSGAVRDPGFAVLSMVHEWTGSGDAPEYRDAVAAEFDLRCHRVIADRYRVFHGALETAHYWEEPDQQLRFFDIYHRYGELLDGDGAEVLLSGVGAEATVLTEAPPPLHLAELLRGLRLRRFASQLKEWQRARRIPYINLLLRFVLVPLLAAPRDRYMVPTELPSWVAPGFLRRMDLKKRVNRAWAPRIFDGAGDQWQWEKVVRATSILYRGYLEKMCQVRYPFLSRPLIELSLSIPYEAKVAAGQFKPLLREAMRGTLPELVRLRADKGNINRWVIDSLAKEWPNLEPLLRSSVLASLGFVDGEAIRRAAHLMTYGRASRTTLLCSAIALEIWLRRMVGDIQQT